MPNICLKEENENSARVSYRHPVTIGCRRMQFNRSVGSCLRTFLPASEEVLLLDFSINRIQNLPSFLRRLRRFFVL